MSERRTLILPVGLVGLCVVLVALGALTALAQVPGAQAPRPSSFTTRVWDFTTSPAGPTRAVVMVPTTMRPGVRLPLLVAFHGWGETQRAWERGAWGWAQDYELGASDHELRRASLRVEAFLGFVDPSRFRRLRRDLTRRPYQGVIVVAPYTPDILDPDAGDRSREYGDWVVNTLIPKARAELPVLSDRGATGIDGVSLGGFFALETGFLHPETFGAVGALQAAVYRRVDRVLARYVPSPTRPPQRIRLVASRGDRLTRDIRALDAAMTARGIPHELREVEGPHDYIFNRGAGGVEMLLFHDRALRGLPAE